MWNLYSEEFERQCREESNAHHRGYIAGKVSALDELRDKINELQVPLNERDTSDIQWAERFTLNAVLKIIDDMEESIDE